MDDQVELSVAQLEPCAGKIEGRARDLTQAEHVAIEAASSVEIGHR
jgi:hypothetical protein